MAVHLRKKSLPMAQTMVNRRLGLELKTHSVLSSVKVTWSHQTFVIHLISHVSTKEEKNTVVSNKKTKVKKNTSPRAERCVRHIVLARFVVVWARSRHICRVFRVFNLYIQQKYVLVQKNTNKRKKILTYGLNDARRVV